jgi:hypothetical protein
VVDPRFRRGDSRILAPAPCKGRCRKKDRLEHCFDRLTPALSELAGRLYRLSENGGSFCRFFAFAQRFQT